MKASALISVLLVCGVFGAHVSAPSRVRGFDAAQTGASTTAATVATAASSVDARAAVADVAGRLADFWRSTLGARVVSYREPDAIVYYRSRIESACGLTYLENARYCPDDRTIYLDESWIESFLATGDDGWIAILAHEWGHEVQDELGALTLSEERPYLRALELQADCYAGVFTRAEQNQGLRGPQTAADARRFFATAGDPNKTTGSHGTGAQRDRWFDAGRGSGFSACLDVFKKEHALPRIPTS